MKASAQVKQLIFDVRSGKWVHNLDLSNLMLSGVDLSELKGDKIRFDFADISCSKLCLVRIENSSFKSVQMNATDCRGATLRLCSLEHAKAAGALFDSARIEDCNAKGADFSDAYLKVAKLTESSFERASMKGAILDHAYGEGVDFRGADMRGVVLTNSCFEDADFRGADLRGADLSNGSFRSADFRGALFSDTKFDGADYEGAFFDAGFEPDAKTGETGERSTTTGDKTISDLLGEGLAAVFATHDKWIDGAGDYVKDAVEMLRATSEQPPEVVKKKAESLANLVQEKHPPTVEALLEALLNGPLGLQSLVSRTDVSKEEIAQRLQALLKSLSTDDDQPPAEVKRILQHLMDQQGKNEMKSLQEALERLLNPGSD